MFCNNFFFQWKQINWNSLIIILLLLSSLLYLLLLLFFLSLFTIITIIYIYYNKKALFNILFIYYKSALFLWRDFIVRSATSQAKTLNPTASEYTIPVGFMASAVTLKKNYKCFQSLQQFYTGGPYAVSSDGSFLVCACDDTIKIVDSSNAAIKSTIEGDSEPVTALILSPNDNFLFSASHSRQIRVWDLSSLKCLRSWKVSFFSTCYWH